MKETFIKIEDLIIRKLLLKVFIVVILNSWITPLFAQYFYPLNGFAIEVSLENTDLKRLPIYRNSISSLQVVGDFIIGGTSANEGLSPYIFVASLSERKVISIQDLNNIVSGQQSIQSGFCRGKNHILFAGTIINNSNITNASSAGGHLIQVKIGTKGTIDIKDLGIPISGEGVYSLICNTPGTMLYGISYPSGLFFAYNIKTGKTRIFKDIAPSKKDIDTLEQYILKPLDYLCRSLIQDDEGLIYGSQPINKLFYFNPKDESFHILKNSLPTVWGLMMLGRVDSWAKSKDGKLYGGNAGDGQLFVIDPSTKKVRNLGKPIMMNGLRGLTFGRDGKLYGVAGAPPGYVHLFSYDHENGFYDFGNPEFEMAAAPGIEQGINWRGFNISTIASSEDGKYVVMGEDEALSQLLIYTVEGK